MVAIVLSAGPLAVLGHGLAGAGSIFTGLVLAAPTALLLLMGRWRDLAPDICDLLFVLFCGFVAVSLAVNGVAAQREALLLGLSLAAYPAVRVRWRCGKVPPGFIAVTSVLVAVGAVVTTVALIGQWNDNHGKPLVFDQYDAAPAQFTISLGFLLLALACTELDWRKTAVISALAAIPTAIFAAAIVRYSFIAIVLALAAVVLVSEARQRKFVLAILCAVIVAVATGALVRSTTTLKFVRLASEALISESAAPSQEPATAASPDPATSSCPAIDRDNSIVIRQQLYIEAFALLPEAGLTGLGLDGFPQRSCLKGFQVHNSVLQVIIEFGWGAGVVLILLICYGVGARMFSLARINREARFVLCGLLFTLMLTMAHGRISRDVALFLFLGYAARIRSNALDIEEQAWMLSAGPVRPYRQPVPALAAEGQNS